jgi:hypothetical protein
MEPFQDYRVALDKELHQALQRVGRTPETRVQWLIDVGYRYAKGGELSKAAMRALRWEMAVFCAPDRDYEKRPPAPMLENDARRWLVRICNGIQRLAAGQAWGHRLVTHYGLWVPRVGQSPGILSKSRGDGLPRGFIQPKESDALHIARTRKDDMAHFICEALAAVGDRLRRCHNKKCGRLFVRVKRQFYCTPACASVVRVRKHRAKQREAAKV